VLTGFGKPELSVFVKSVAEEGKSGRFSSRTKFDSSSMLILLTNKWTTARARGKEHYLEVAVCRGGSLALDLKRCVFGAGH
jgi:hypothetical protein